MNESRNVFNYDVIILGAGPAGCACALTLKNSGLKVALIDKSRFPRDKVCGDAISNKAVKILEKLSSEYVDEFKVFAKKYLIRKTWIGYENRGFFLTWKGDSYTCSRLDFDNFLFTLVSKYTNTVIHNDEHISDIESNPLGVILSSKDTESKFHATIVVGADGSKSIVRKKLANNYADKNYLGEAVRAYFKNVKTYSSDTTEVYIQNKFYSGFFWIFPLPDNTANVGFCMFSNYSLKNKINIKKSFYDFIETSAVLKEKFGKSQMHGDLEEFDLPLGLKKLPISGEHFLLTGDAASLMDPLGGIGNAMLSGRLAANHIRKCFAKDDFGAAYLKKYDKKVYSLIGNELRLRYYMQLFIYKFPFILKLIFKFKGNKINTIR